MLHELDRGLIDEVGFGVGVGMLVASFKGPSDWDLSQPEA
jgi:hypothetical protein